MSQGPMGANRTSGPLALGHKGLWANMPENQLNFLVASRGPGLLMKCVQFKPCASHGPWPMDPKARGLWTQRPFGPCAHGEGWGTGWGVANTDKAADEVQKRSCASKPETCRSPLEGRQRYLNHCSDYSGLLELLKRRPVAYCLDLPLRLPVRACVRIGRFVYSIGTYTTTNRGE